MKLTALGAAEVAVLDAALDGPTADIRESLQKLDAAVTAALPSYLGLSVVVRQHDSAFTVACLDDAVTLGDIGTSIKVPLTNPGDGDDAAVIAIILYAGAPGAFVDLAADLASFAGDPPQLFVLDAHLGVQPNAGTLPSATSVINQAIGVLVSRGSTIEQAHWVLDTQASVARTDRLTAANLVLDTVTIGGDHHSR